MAGASCTLRVRVTKVELVEVASPDPFYREYGSFTASKWFQIKVEGRDEESGKMVYLHSPNAIHSSVATPPGAGIAIVLFTIPDSNKLWVEEVGDDAVAEKGKPNNNHLELKIKEGQVLTVRGAVQERTSMRGNDYLTMNRVGLQEVSK